MKTKYITTLILFTILISGCTQEIINPPTILNSNSLLKKNNTWTGLNFFERPTYFTDIIIQDAHIIDINSSLIIRNLDNTIITNITGGTTTGTGNIYFNNNVGIGTTSPNSKFVVTSDSSVGGSSSTAITADAPGITTSDYAIKLRAKSGAGAVNELMVVRGDGNVGIGDSTPDFILDVEELNAGGTATISIANTHATANSHARLRLRAQNGDTKLFFDSNSAKGWNLGMDKTDGSFKISENTDGTLETTPKITIVTGGNIGIGTTSPSQLLELHSNENAITQMEIENDNTGSSAGTGIRFYSKRTGYNIPSTIKNLPDAYGSNIIFNVRNNAGTYTDMMTINTNGISMIGDLTVEGNINVTGCICYDGGATCLGTCI
jgi:hypothetical protein